MSWEDPIVEEIRRYRQEYGAKFNHDLQAIYEDLKRQQEESGLTYVDFSVTQVEEHDTLKKAS